MPALKMPSREALAAAMKRQQPETDAQKTERLAAGFAGDCNSVLDGVPEVGSGFPQMTGDLAAKSPTVPSESHGESAEAEPAVFVPSPAYADEEISILPALVPLKGKDEN